MVAAVAAPLLLGGVLPVETSLEERWPAAGAWLMPVGDLYSLGASYPGAPVFRESRGIRRRAGRITHQGSDLLNGRAGDTVRAVAHGIVLKASRSERDGYGDHVVIAHRDRQGAIHYSIYAHLLSRSIRIGNGDVVAAGQPIARVGSTGRATTPHLHFEVRDGADPGRQWELAPVIEPIAFIQERLPALREDGSWAGLYLEWGERAALVPAGTHADDALSRERWWRMIAHSAMSPLLGNDRDAARLRDTLIALGVLPEDEAGGAPEHAMNWSDLSRDVRRLRDLGVRLPPAPSSRDSLRAMCELRLGCERPARKPREIARLADPPTVGLVCLVLADLAGEAGVGPSEPTKEISEPSTRRLPKSRKRSRR